MSKRRLVPMPARRRAKRSAAPVATISTIAPSDLKAWHCFAFLITTAVVWHYFRPLLIVVGAIVGFFWGLFWLCERYPRTMFVVLVFVRGLLGRRRR
jgi:hypothetical protein